MLFNGRDGLDDDVVLNPSLSDLSATAEALEQRFPLLGGADFEDMAQQLANQRGSKASSVTCNTYHFGSSAVLCGDAAHAAGGVSGQGVNSALVDSQVLADCLESAMASSSSDGSKEERIGEALLRYSQLQVPEGKALYDLSFGPKPKGFFLRARYLLRSAKESLWRGRLGIGKKPLQTLLTTTLTPFSEIRRDRDRYYDEPFPDIATFNQTLAEIHQEQQRTQVKSLARS